MKDLTPREFCELMRERALEILADHPDFADCVVKEAGSARYDEGGFTLKLEIARKTEDGVNARALAEWNLYAPQYGLSSNLFGEEVEVRGTLYRICGVKPRSPKYPILMKREMDGAIFKFPPTTIKRALGMNQIAARR